MAPAGGMGGPSMGGSPLATVLAALPAGGAAAGGDMQGGGMGAPRGRSAGSGAATAFVPLGELARIETVLLASFGGVIGVLMAFGATLLARFLEFPAEVPMWAVALGLGGSSGIGAASLLKAVPVLGTITAGFVMPALSAGATYAIGKAFIQHFASGGTLLDFNPPDYREFIKAQRDMWDSRRSNKSQSGSEAASTAGS